MNLGLGVGLGFGRKASAVPAFDPASLALTVYLDGSKYNAGTGTWTGTASAGTSATHNASTDGHDPTVGASLNGIATVAFAQASSQRLLFGTPIGNLVTASAYSAWALCFILSESTDSGAYEADDCFFGDAAGAYLNIGVRPDVGSPHHGIDHFDTGSKLVESAFTDNAWALLQWRYDGVHIQSRTNAGVWTSTLAAALGDVSHNGLLGCNYAKLKFINGRIASFGMSKTAFDDATFENIRKGLNARWGLSL